MLPAAARRASPCATALTPRNNGQIPAPADRAADGARYFPHAGDGYRAMNHRTPEIGVAYSFADIRALYDRLGLDIVEPVRFGVWREAGDFQRSQDIVIARKRG